jgi:hypothetical protein
MNVNTMTINEFCDKHGACEDGREWAISTGEPDMDALWRREDIKPEWRVWIATRPGVLPDRELRLFACWCVRQVWHLLTDERSRNAVEVSERFSDGLATKEELFVARNAAWAARATASAAASDAAWAAASTAAWAAASDAARAVASDAAWAAASTAARAAAWSASDAAWATASAAASDAAWSASDAAWATASDAAWAAASTAASDAAWAAQSAYLLQNTTPNFDRKEA